MKNKNSSKTLIDNVTTKISSFANNLAAKALHRKTIVADEIISSPQLPSIYERRTNEELSITHVSPFTYGNAGDTLLPVALRDLWNVHQPEINWIGQPIYPYQVVTEDIVKKINRSKGLVIGGGGLFLKDTHPNSISGWLWPCSVEMLNKIEVPVVVFAVGYNRFRGQEDFDPIFTENIREFAQKSIYLGLRNRGSIESLKQYLPDILHHKLIYQPCPTTFLKSLYPGVANYDEKEDFFVLNCAFDRSHLRFGQGIGKILSDIAITCKEISKHLPLKFYSHMQSDQAIFPFLQAYGVNYDLIDLQNVHPQRIIEEYSRPRLVLGMRGHAQLIPFGCNTPIISIVSHNKMQWFLDDIEQPEWGADVLSGNFKDELLQRSFNVLENHPTVMKYIDEKQRELYRNSLTNTKTALNAMHINK